MPDNEGQFWYNLATGEVERGRQSPGVDRAGPFDTAEAAARAPQLLAERSRAWQDEDEREDEWGAPRAPGSQPH